MNTDPLTGLYLDVPRRLQEWIEEWAGYKYRAQCLSTIKKKMGREEDEGVKVRDITDFLDANPDTIITVKSKFSPQFYIPQTEERRMTNLQPTLDRILVMPDPDDAITEGGIHIPESARKDSQYGTVLAVGPGRTLMDGTVVKVALPLGSRVMFQKMNAGIEVVLNGQTRRLMSEKDVLGVIVPDQPAEA